MPPERHPLGRSEPREITELRQIKALQPELGTAVDMHIALFDLQRRVQSRVSLPWLSLDDDRVRRQQASGDPLLRFEEIPLNWTDFRLMVRQTTDILQRFEALDSDDQQQIQALARDGHALEPVVKQWYVTSAARHPVEVGVGVAPVSMVGEELPAMLEQVLALAIRPFLMRCAEALAPRLDLSGWHHGYCPLCGWDPELAVITPAADRQLLCGRCSSSWKFDPIACPFCGNADRTRITSFATRDGRYRLAGCDDCHKYIKAYDARHATRPVLPAVDAVAMLPLDAEAIRRGYDA
ncbi:MAG TPA: formate dehydrogenase accessory protein FdhE [Vicinamibacterales bacterium]